MPEKRDYLADRDAFEQNDYRTCQTAHGYFGPETRPERVLDTDAQTHNVGANTVGRTHFRASHGRWRRLKKLDDGHYVPGTVETRASKNRLEERKQDAYRIADAVLDAPQPLKNEILRLIKETNLRIFNLLGGPTTGIEAAIVGFAALVLPDGADGGINPIVREAAEALDVSNIDEVVVFTDKQFNYPKK